MSDVSIIVTCFNLGEWLQVALDSALHQSVRCEVVLVDDGSTDPFTRGQVAALRRYADVELSLANHGAPAARNAGAMASSGDYLIFLDADDRLALDYAEHTLAKMHEGVGLVASRAVVVPRPLTVAEAVWSPPSDDLTSDDLRKANRVWSASLVRRQAFVECGGYNPRAWPAEDWFLWADIVRRGWKVRGTAATTFFWRDRADGDHVRIDPEQTRSLMRELFA